MKKPILVSLSMVLIVCTGFVIQGGLFSVSLNMTSQSVNKGQKAKSQSEIYYDVKKGGMVMHYTYPREYYMISNKFGEVKIYDPASNTVKIKNDPTMSTEESLLYLFLTANSADLGFKKLGFSLLDSKFEDELVISTWQPPAHMAKELSKVEIVLKDYKPIYLAYINTRGEFLKKIYYSGYMPNKSYKLPLRVTTIDYLERRDSIVTRIDYSNVQENQNANAALSGFKIPDNAKPVD